MNRPALIALALALSGCAAQPYWEFGGVKVYEPAQIRLHYVPVVGPWCGFPAPGHETLGCALRYLDVCNVYIRSDQRGDPCVLLHEVRHCLGWEHPRNPTHLTVVC